MNEKHLMSDIGSTVALLVLLGAAAAVGLLDLGAWGVALGRGVAGVKVVLSGVFFMDLGKSTSLARLFTVAGLYWVAILMVLTLADMLTRSAAYY